MEENSGCEKALNVSETQESNNKEHKLHILHLGLQQ
jgi:hypothetical protein